MASDRNETKIVAIVGPESTGKTTLAGRLTDAVNGVWLPEFAREYLTDASYSEEDVHFVAREQLAREMDLLRAVPEYAIFDTDAVVLRIWFSERFGHVPDFIERHLVIQTPRFYLLLYPDLEWQYDSRRESKGDLERLFQEYESVLVSKGASYGVVKGRGEERLTNAMAFIEW